MKVNTKEKSSFTLPLSEARVVLNLKRKLKCRSNTEVIRLALQELQHKLDRDQLRESFKAASHLVRIANKEDLQELDFLAGEGI